MFYQVIYWDNSGNSKQYRLGIRNVVDAIRLTRTLVDHKGAIKAETREQTRTKTLIFQYDGDF